MKNLITLAIFFICFVNVKSQDIFYELETPDSAGNTVSVFQPLELHMLVNKHKEINKTKENK